MNTHTHENMHVDKYTVCFMYLDVFSHPDSVFFMLFLGCFNLDLEV